MSVVQKILARPICFLCENDGCHFPMYASLNWWDLLLPMTKLGLRWMKHRSFIPASAPDVDSCHNMPTHD